MGYTDRGNMKKDAAPKEASPKEAAPKAPASQPAGSGEKRGFKVGAKLSQDNLGDFAKIGSSMLRKTVATGMEVLKDVTDSIPKEATQFLAKSKDDLLKNVFSKEVLQSIVSSTVDRLFSRIREHRLEITVRIRRVKEEEK